MNANTRADALVCEDVAVRFPLTTPARRWRLLFGEAPDQWHDALSGVNLRVPQGKIVGVIGRNGAGKSTLLRTLAGVYPLARGRVVRLGPVSALFELGGMGGLLITGRQYVQRWLRLQGIARREWPALIEEIREFSELGPRLDDRIYTYSAGMKARLYFSTATSVGHDIYLIDEVLSVGDEHFQAKCWKRVRERLQGGVSGVLVTHDWSAILRLCENACELEQGRLVAFGSAEEVICNYLDIAAQLDATRLAEFAHDCPESVEVHTGGAWSCDIPVLVHRSAPVFFNYSIEKLALGNDWQILFMGMVSSAVAGNKNSQCAGVGSLCGRNKVTGFQFCASTDAVRPIRRPYSSMLRHWVGIPAISGLTLTMNCSAGRALIWIRSMRWSSTTACGSRTTRSMTEAPTCWGAIQA